LFVQDTLNFFRDVEAPSAMVSFLKLKVVLSQFVVCPEDVCPAGQAPQYSTVRQLHKNVHQRDSHFVYLYWPAGHHLIAPAASGASASRSARMDRVMFVRVAARPTARAGRRRYLSRLMDLPDLSLSML